MMLKRLLKDQRKLLQKKQTQQMMNQNLKENDPDLYSLICRESVRQQSGINLIASENYSSKSVREALGSVLSNKYSEGYPGNRYYGGNELIDQIESLCQKRALDLYDLDQKQWGVNVQALSGSPANFAAYTGLLKPHDRIMSLDLPHGGHLSHGFQTPVKKISGTSVYFEVLPYRLDQNTGYIDYTAMEEMARLYRPKLIIAGTSAYSRNIEYERMSKLCMEINAILLSDMAHISGLVAGKQVPSPFPYSDIVTTTTHKSLRGPRGAMIFYRLGPQQKNNQEYDYKSRIDQAVFPGMQGGPHNHTIGALANALKQANSNEFIEYQQKVVENSKELCAALQGRGYDIVSGGTDNHLILVDLKNKGADGSRVECVFEMANIYINKNTVPGDKRPLYPSGIRLGSPAMTTRGCGLKDFQQIASFIDQGVAITNQIKKDNPKLKLEEFKTFVRNGQFNTLDKLKQDVIQFTNQFPHYD